MISIIFAFKPDGGHRDVLFHYVKRWWGQNFPHAQICVGTNDDEIFNRSKARNEAAKQANEDILIIADADTIPTVRGVDAAVMEAVDKDRWMLPYGPDRYYNLNRETTEAILHKNLDGLDEPNGSGYDHKITSWAGCLVMPRAAFDAVGGYDERFIGWGYEDNSFQLAIDTIWGRHGRINSYCLHLWHPIAFQTTFDSPHINHNRQLFSTYQAALGSPEKMKMVRS